MELFLLWLHHMFILNKKLVRFNVSKSKNQEQKIIWPDGHVICAMKLSLSSIFAGIQYTFLIVYSVQFLSFSFYFQIVLKQLIPGSFLQSYNLHNCSHFPPNQRPNWKEEGRREELSLLLCEKVLLN